METKSVHAVLAGQLEQLRPMQRTCHRAVGILVLPVTVPTGSTDRGSSRSQNSCARGVRVCQKKLASRIRGKRRSCRGSG